MSVYNTTDVPYELAWGNKENMWVCEDLTLQDELLTMWIACRLFLKGKDYYKCLGEFWTAGLVCNPWSAKFTSVDGEPISWWARNLPPCYPFHMILLCSIFMPRNWRKWMIWCHGSPRVSKPSPDTIFSFMANYYRHFRGSTRSFIMTILFSFNTRWRARYSSKWQSLPLSLTMSLLPLPIAPLLPSCSIIPSWLTWIIYIIIYPCTYSNIW